VNSEFSQHGNYIALFFHFLLNEFILNELPIIIAIIL